MRVTITIDTSNAAFDNNQTTEIQRILCDIANKIADFGIREKVLRDINGNIVGELKIKI